VFVLGVASAFLPSILFNNVRAAAPVSLPWGVFSAERRPRGKLRAFCGDCAGTRKEAAADTFPRA
jgi:hypothetical protein